MMLAVGHSYEFRQIVKVKVNDISEVREEVKELSCLTPQICDVIDRF
jgi:hypothetical protein